MPPQIPIAVLEMIETLGPDPFLRCGCLECLEVVEVWIANDCPITQEIAA